MFKTYRKVWFTYFIDFRLRLTHFMLFI
jgi:hypothetical protein